VTKEKRGGVGGEKKKKKSSTGGKFICLCEKVILPYEHEKRGRALLPKEGKGGRTIG